ncbi:leukotriene B4 receptor 1-like [Lampris incognitus]|uniref:leukotriene B4 receptor 1-like n=1 Tax=Lampris incognitus TaxID=2546036 RepID=UPI0024B605DC|nr:leukotriene B4 receptor 1-like [Lampris incognitus]
MAQKNGSASFMPNTPLNKGLQPLCNCSVAQVTSLPPSIISSPGLLSTSMPLESIMTNTASTAVGALILSLVFLLGVPGNFFIIWTILTRARKRSVTTLLILNLACADGFLMALTPFFIIYLVRKAWVFGNVMCKVLFYLCLANMYASIQLIMLMSLHRLVAVMWPQRVSAITGRRIVLRVLLGVWVLVLAASVPAVIFREERLLPFPNDRSRLVCEPFHKLWSHVVVCYTLELVLGFVIPYGVIVGSYICIWRRIRQTKFRRRIFSEKLILAIVVTFCLFWLPYHIINMVKVAAALCPEGSKIKASLELVWQTWRAITSSLAFISSSANPVLYVFAGRSYIRQDGLAFMARLFEGTALDSGTKKGRQSSQNSRDKDKNTDGLMLKERDPDSATNTSTNLNVKNGNLK